MNNNSIFMATNKNVCAKFVFNLNFLIVFQNSFEKSSPNASIFCMKKKFDLFCFNEIEFL